jgi:hypothetical protein
MLMITTTVRMVDGVHSNTTSLGPAVTLNGVLVLSTGRLCRIISNYPSPFLVESRTQHRLIGTSSTSNNSDHSTSSGRNNFLGTGWELNTSLALVRVVSNDGNIVSGCSSKRTTVTSLLLDIANHGTFWDRGKRKNVADLEVGVFAGVDKLSRVHSLVGDESLGVELESVRVPKDHFGQRSTTSRVVNDVLHSSSYISMTLGVIEGSEKRRILVEAGMGREL